MASYVFLFLSCLLIALSQPLSALPAQASIINEEEQVSQDNNPLLALANSPTSPTSSTQDGDVIIEEEGINQPAIPSIQIPSVSAAKKHEDKGGAPDNKENSPAKERNDIYLNFENSSLSNVVNYMAELRNINLLPDKALAEVKVSLTIREPLTVDGAWNIFLTLLEVSGFSIVEVGGLHKVLPKDKKMTEALPNYINVPYTTLPDSDLTIRYVMFLQNLQAESVRELLESLLSDNKKVYAYAQANCFIITDRCYNIKSAMKIIQELDSMGQPETVVVMRLKRTNATDVKGLIEGLMSKRQDNNPLARFFAKPADTSTEYFPSGTKIVAEDRTNSLILMGVPEPIKKIEKFITEYIDVDLKAAESPLHIYEVQYADASALAEILQTVTAPPDQGPGEQAARYGAIRGGVKYFKSMKFTVDKDANRLIISCTDKNDWALLEGIIKDLDKPQPQVAIETLYVSIDETDVKQMGGSIRNKKEGQLGHGVNFQAASIASATLKEPEDNNPVTLLGNMLNQLITSQGSTLLTFGRATNIWAVFEMLKTKTNASILSQPFLTVANKITGKLTVGSENNVVTERSDSGQPGYGVVSADTSLEIEPQINLDGVIRLKISVNISEFTNPDKGDKSTNQLNTNISMADGQVLVLGGFIQTKVSEATNKTPLLADVPILGWFFKNQKRRVDRKYIFIFMAPTIIKPRTVPGVELYSKMKLHDATNYIETGIKTVKSNDPVSNWFFDPKAENYSHKVVDFANARYQPTTVDIKNDLFYRSNVDDKVKQGAISHESTARLIPPAVDNNQPGVEILAKPIETVIVQADQPVIMTTDDKDKKIETTSDSNHKDTIKQTAIIPNESIMTNPMAQRASKTKAIIDPSELLTLATKKEPSASLDTAQQAPKDNTKNADIQELVNTRLGIADKKPSLQANTFVERMEKTPTLESELETGAPLPQNPYQEPTIETDGIEPHPAQQDVQNFLNERMQKQRHVSLDNEQLAHQRKKLKSLISQTLNGTKNSSSGSVHDNEKQKALKSLLSVPSTNQTGTPNRLIVDPAKRNSLKNFLSQAEQTGKTTRNNPT